MKPPSHPLVINGVTIRRAVEIGAGDRCSSELISYGSHVDWVELWEPNAVLAQDLIEAAVRRLVTLLVRISFTPLAMLRT